MPITSRMDQIIHWQQKSYRAEERMADNLAGLTDAVAALTAEVVAVIAALPKPEPSQQATIDGLTTAVNQLTTDLKAAVPTP